MSGISLTLWAHKTGCVYIWTLRTSCDWTWLEWKALFYVGSGSGVSGGLWRIEHDGRKWLGHGLHTSTWVSVIHYKHIKVIGKPFNYFMQCNCHLAQNQSHISCAKHFFLGEREYVICNGRTWAHESHYTFQSFQQHISLYLYSFLRIYSCCELSPLKKSAV